MASGAEQVDDPVSVGFARDMNTHHAQAVAMSEIVHRRSDDPEINYLTFDIHDHPAGPDRNHVGLARPVEPKPVGERTGHGVDGRVP